MMFHILVSAVLGWALGAAAAVGYLRGKRGCHTSGPRYSTPARREHCPECKCRLFTEDRQVWTCPECARIWSAAFPPSVLERLEPKWRRHS